MSNKIWNSILITTILVLSVYFVSSGLVENNSGAVGTTYNITDPAGNNAHTSTWWNPRTNYTVNYTALLSGNNRALQFNFTINNSASIASLAGNITNISISFLNGTTQELVQISYGSGNISNHSSIWQATAVSPQTIMFYNDTNGLSNVTSGDMASIGYFTVNVSINGTANTNTELTGTIQINISNLTTCASENTNSLTFTYGVDSQAPRITNITAEAIGTITSAADNIYMNGVDDNITISAYITDANLMNRTSTTTNYNNVTLWWTNSTRSGKPASIGINDSINMTLTKVSGSDNTWLATATLPKLLNGMDISFIITAADYFEFSGNATNSQKSYNITIDSTIPDDPIINIPDVRIIEQRTYTITCSGEYRTVLTDVTNGVTICDSAVGSCEDWTATNQGTVQLQCVNYDEAGNSKTITQDITIYSSSTTGVVTSSGTPSGTTSETVDISSTEQTIETSAGQTSIFTYGTKEHTLKIERISDNSVTVSVDGGEETTIGSTQSKEIDVDGDGNNDIKVTLNAVRLNKADISIEKLASATQEVSEETTQTKSSLWWLWILLVLVIAGIVVYVVTQNKKK